MTRQDRQFWLLQTAVWLVYGIESYLAAIGLGRPMDHYRLVLIDAGCGFVLSLLLREVYDATWHLSVRQRIAWGSAALVACSLLGGYVWAVAIRNMCVGCKPPAHMLGYLAYFFGWMYGLLAWSGAYIGIKLARQLQHERETALQATAMAHQAQLRMLRYQLNPHFLFNTLNAISTLVLDDRREQANGMVGALSSFLRYSLESDPQQKVTLEQELGAIRRYLAIEQMRFGERLRVGILVTPPSGSALMPSLLLQPLIENAVKYGMSRREEGGRIEIVARVQDGVVDIAVRDDGPGSLDYRPGGGSNGAGVGLANTRERLRVLYGERHHFTIRKLQPIGTEVQLQFPFEPSRPEEPADADPHPDRR
ncbi:MAG: sensor histidine kinase [Rhodanobacteraceae bacterium]|jgi:signal transduction histidine kinase|nr:sensor histidine kinase [Rhodanobacteraceae bacterium]